MGKTLDTRLEKQEKLVLAEMQKLVFMRRLQSYGSDKLISQFEQKGYGTIRSKEFYKEYNTYYPDTEDLQIILTMLS